jgi:cytochrome P450
MTTFRTLALLGSHREQAARVRDEIGGNGSAGRHPLPYLRACILESLRLWPTTPLVLRETTVETTWETGVMPANTGIIIFAPFFHRDDQRLPYADRFTPELWLKERTALDWPLIPFSAGPAVCPGQNLVLLLTSAMISALMRDRQIHLQPPARVQEDLPLPGTLNHFTLRFHFSG